LGPPPLRSFALNERSFNGVMRHVAVAVACAIFASAATAELIEVKLAPETVIDKRLVVAAGKSAELCSPLKQGQVVLWQFGADAASHFNIQYHVDKKVEYPEQRRNIKDADGRLVIKVDQDYCWMWTNRTGSPIAVHVTLKAK
jgi:hypothetical protein